MSAQGRRRDAPTLRSLQFLSYALPSGRHLAQCRVAIRRRGTFGAERPSRPLDDHIVPVIDQSKRPGSVADGVTRSLCGFGLKTII